MTRVRKRMKPPTRVRKRAAIPLRDVCPMCGGNRYIKRNGVLNWCPACAASGKRRNTSQRI